MRRDGGGSSTVICGSASAAILCSGSIHWPLLRIKKTSQRDSHFALEREQWGAVRKVRRGCASTGNLWRKKGKFKEIFKWLYLSSALHFGCIFIHFFHDRLIECNLIKGSFTCFCLSFTIYFENHCIFSFTFKYWEEKCGEAVPLHGLRNESWPVSLFMLLQTFVIWSQYPMSCVVFCQRLYVCYYFWGAEWL